MSGSSGTSKGHVYELDPPVLADGLVELQSCSAGTQFILTSRTKVPKYIFGLFKEHGTLRLVYCPTFLHRNTENSPESEVETYASFRRRTSAKQKNATSLMYCKSSDNCTVGSGTPAVELYFCINLTSI